MSEDTQQRRWYRRMVLSATAASLVGLAGCSSTGGQGDSPETSSPDSEENSTDTASSGTDTTTEGSDEPPAPYQNDIGIIPGHLDGNSNKYTAEYSGPGSDATELWTASISSYGNPQSLVAYNGQVTISGQTPSEGTGMRSFDGTGDRLWERDLNYDLYPASEETLIGADGNEIIGLSTADGSRQFLHSTPDLEGSRTYMPVIDGQTLYYRASEAASSEETIAAVNAQEGNVVNRTTVSGETTGIFTDLTGTLVGDRLISYGSPSTVLDLNDLSKQATISLGVSSIEVYKTTIAAVGDMLYLHSTPDGLFAYDLNAGELRWSNTEIYNGTAVRAAIADESSVYLVRPQSILAYSASDGSKQWEAPLTNQISTLSYTRTPVAIGSESMYVGLGNGNISILNTEDGQQTGRITDTGGVIPTVVGNRLYTLGDDLTVYGPA
ncbi:PQQ-binding-like beta-propeller repeat protein [Haloarcula litorea]|uniref:outer membrane protein assembly factor BamB family protein n=1 Tax=Haloarcula litorea TaxID=3032579 RepID=UPI0023E8A3C8|nr:PQQ-binding-like beta-propeller repeat protein [Halomicroarcula sp. GDY20]